jgi:hypothetical protein
LLQLTDLDILLQKDIRLVGGGDLQRSSSAAESCKEAKRLVPTASRMQKMRQLNFLYAATAAAAATARMVLGLPGEKE